LHAEPLYPLLAKRRVDIEAPDGCSTGCHRHYVGSWDIADGWLRLVNLSTYGCNELPLSTEMRAWFLALVPSEGFPLRAKWFSGRLRVPTGPRLVRALIHGWSSWFTKERVITCRRGRVVRDREVDTLAMLERALRRDKFLKERLDPNDTPGGPEAWSAEHFGDFDHLRGDWWPPN